MVTKVSNVATDSPETIAWDSGTQKVDKELPKIIVLLIKSMLTLLASGSKPSIVVVEVRITGRNLCAPVLTSKSK